MAKLLFDKVRLAGKANQLITEWWGDVEAEESCSAANLNDRNSIFLPPMKPELLEV